MTQIYTQNTILITPKSNVLTYTEGETCSLVADISFVWIDTSPAQRFLVYKWQESDNGTDWTDIANNTSEHPLSLNNIEKTIFSSKINDDLLDLTLAEFNLAQDKKVSTSLEISNILLAQNNYKYRCIVLLYNNNLNTIESAATTEPITLNIKPKNTAHVLPVFDIPWDPMNPRAVIKNGSLSLDSSAKLEIFKPNKSICGTQWRIIEVGYGTTYLSGNITNGNLVGLPKSYGPNNQSYPGYMELQSYCNNKWVTQESWISLIGNPEYAFDMYLDPTTVTVDINGQTIVPATKPGSVSNPLIVNLGLSQNDTINEIPRISIDGISTSGSVSESFFATNIPGPTSCGTALYGLKTITIPEYISLPANVTITGSSDDDFAVNGNLVKGGGCTGAGNFSPYTFISNSRTFTIAAVDNFGGNASYNVNIVFTSNATSSNISSPLKTNEINILTINQISDSAKVAVSSSQSWQNSGFSIIKGSRLDIQATGLVTWNTSGSTSGPDGVSFADSKLDNRFPHEALLGRIGTSAPFLIGSSFKGLAEENGILQLATNDTSRFDNQGSFIADIKVANPNDIGVRIVQDNLEPYNSDIMDNNFAQVSLLASVKDGDIIDNSNYKKIFNSTNITTSTSNTKYGGLKALYNENGFSVTNSDDSLRFDADFTVEGWFFFDRNNVGYQGLVSTYNNSDTTGWALVIESNNRLYFYGSSTGYGGWPVNISTNYTPAINQWIHLAVVRSGSSIKIYADGIEIGSANSSLAISSGTKLEIGNYLYFPGGRQPLRGSIEEIRITKGLARYSSNFPTSLPNKPFPKLGYQSTKIVDISAMQKSATPVFDQNNQLSYFVLKTTSDSVGPFHTPGSLSLVFSVNPNSPSITPTPTPSQSYVPTTATPTPTITSSNTPTPTITPTVTPSMSVPVFDPLYSQTSLLLNMSGTNNSRSIIDSSVFVHNIVATGDAVISTSRSRFGGSSLSIPANTNKNAIYANASEAFNFSSGNFTIEFWLNQNSTPQSGARVFQTSEDDNNQGISIFYPSTNNSLVAQASDGNQQIVLSLGSTENNVWGHYAFVRNNNTFTTYKNGVNIAETIRSINISPSSGIVSIGGNALSGTNRSVNAFIDDFRITKAPRYSGIFTPSAFEFLRVGPPITPTVTPTSTNTPTISVTPSITSSQGSLITPTPTNTVTVTPSSAGSDPFWANVALLLPLNGNNNATDITDLSSNPASFANTNNNIILKTDIFKSGPSSAYMAGNGNATSTNNKYIIGSNDFTLELWAYSTVALGNNDRGIIHLRSSNNTYSGIGIGVTQYGDWGIYSGGQERRSLLTRTQNVWVHLAITRNNNVLKFWVNGSETLSVSDSTNYNISSLFFGNWYSTSFGFTGYVDDVRLTIGTARYTNTFSPPASLPTN